MKIDTSTKQIRILATARHLDPIALSQLRPAPSGLFSYKSVKKLVEDLKKPTAGQVTCGQISKNYYY